MQASSRLSGFYQLGQAERLSKVKDFAALSDETVQSLKNSSALPFDLLDRLVETPLVGSPCRWASRPT